MLDVIIVNWNAGAQLRTCIDSIAEHASGIVKRAVVVDNGSTDGSDATVEGLPNVTLIRANANLGFGKASNLGAARGESEFLLFLNPDAALSRDTLSKALEFMRKSANAKVGICGVQLLDKSGRVARSCARFPSSLGFVAHAAGVDRICPRLAHVMADWDHGQTRQVDHVIGAFFLVRRRLFNALGGFDERFFVYLEDVDFSLRASQQGWSSVYLTNAQAFHAGGGTSNQIKALRLFYSLRSRVLYAFKHFSVLGATAVLAATLLMEPISRSALALARRSRPALQETWAAYAMLWRWLPHWVLQRQTR